MGENRGSLGGADEPRVGPWALEAMPGETGFSAIAAGALSAAQAARASAQAAFNRLMLTPAVRSISTATGWLSAVSEMK